tara:strand:- start:774 stop:1256 length:483 start_codon:yes stop_codon:yes gene_type:complete
MSRSAREIDLDPRTYVGLSFPLRADNNNNFAMTKNSIQQSRHNLRNLLLTYPGERAGNPEFGCRLRELCFEQHNESLPSRIETEIVEATNQFLPYINIIDVETLTDANQQEKIFVSIKFSTTLDPQVNQALTLDVGEATEVGDSTGDSTGGSTSGRPGGY